jgi:hypothetical protein
VCQYGSCVIPGGPIQMTCTAGAWIIQPEFCAE